MSARKRPVVETAIPAGQARAALLLALARLASAVGQVEEVATAIARALDATAKRKGASPPKSRFVGGADDFSFDDAAAKRKR